MEQLAKIQEDTLEKIAKAERNFKKTPKDRVTLNYIETRLETLEELWKEFKSRHLSIVMDCNKEQKEKLPYFTRDIYEQFEEQYTNYKCNLKEKYKECKPATKIVGDGSSVVSGSETVCDVMLPRLQIPTFTGKYDEWQTFHDMFLSAINNNKNLSAVQKLHYLKSSLSGEPERLIRNLSTTELNYEEAWKQLTRRYNNKKYNCNIILKNLFAQRQIYNESASAIKQLLDTTSSCLKSLDNIGIKTSTWDAIIIHLTMSKLDKESHRQWEIQQSQMPNEDLPTWLQLIDFLESRFRALEMVDSKQITTKPAETTSKPFLKAKTFHTTVEAGLSKRDVTCVLCNGPHSLYHCQKFEEKSPKERQDYVQATKLCFNCLSPTHPVKFCRKPTSCHTCGRRHHTKLHFEREVMGGPAISENTNTKSTPTEEISKRPPTNTLHERRLVVNFAKGDNYSSEVLLPTAVIKAVSRNGYKFVIRALLDQCSQASFVTEATVQLLGLKRTPVNACVSGLGDSDVRINHLVLIQVESRHHNASVQVEAYVLNTFPTRLPLRNIEKPAELDIEDLSLADPDFNSSGKIDILLGSEIYSQVLLPGLRKTPQENAIVQDSIFGWIISGKGSEEAAVENKRVITLYTRENEDNLLKKFWELENEPDNIQKMLTKDEIKCEEIYKATTVRNGEGCFVVKLPFNCENPECQYGNTKEIAIRRYEQLQRKLTRNPKLHMEYQKVMQEYLDLNHMRIIEDQSEIDKQNTVYLPHHAVVREDKDTTKVRVVFDASCKGLNNVSLNDNLYIGPKLQQDLRYILMRWRTHPIAIVADLVKMYRQVRVRDEDTHFQIILWKPTSSDILQHYELLTLTFGTACAPYLAVRSLHKLAEEEEETCPLAAEITKRDFYVDDLMTGCMTEEEGIKIYTEMMKMMNRGGFQLQKWSSNSKELLRHIGEDDHILDIEIPIKEDNMIKVLGIQWNRNTDNFQYAVSLPEASEPVTKRQVLSHIARLYDPMGWISPIVIKAKLFIQKLWKLNLSWDDELPSELLTEWLNYRQSLIHVKKIEVPRWVRSTQGCKVELHAFSDASKAAFAASVYLRVVDKDNGVSISLIAAKTKVAPLEKEISIPRLELCGATLAAKLLSEVAQVMNISKENMFAWTDSTVVLAWLRGLPSRWTTFVSNRVSTILNILDSDQWGHIVTNENPADCASRGLHPTELLQHSIWWHGPEWLSQPVINANKQSFMTHEEERTIKAFATVKQTEEECLWSKYSSLTRMLNILSYCRRILNLRIPKEERPKLPKFITNAEKDKILQLCIKQVQQLEFTEEIKRLKNNDSVSKKSVLNTLCPSLDEDGLLRVGGRIHLASNISYNTRHPIIIPSKNQLAKLIISDAHERTIHGGPQVMLNYLRTKYWIIRARDQVKKCFRECVTCLRYSKIKRNQLMGQLPQVRLTPSKPFKASGVDYAGPINVRFSPGRGAKSYKGYICVFICMVTHAIHLEVVSDLTAKGFIAAFRRFTARRGHCQDLYSDNGTNFIGADKELRHMFNTAKSELSNEIAQILTLDGTTWHFIPPHAPNFGGLWEAGVRLMKSHLKRVIGNSTLTYEELATVLAQIEACLNSRPLTKLSDDPNDPLPLTPGHFLVGEPLINIPDGKNSSCNTAGLERWKLAQKMINDFWKRWSKEYIVTLNQSYKWNTKKEEPEIGDIVVVKEDNLPPAKWILGKIMDKHPGKDNITRVVTIKCKNTLLKRPVNKLCILPK